jgi:hypothetical protein
MQLPPVPTLLAWAAVVAVVLVIVVKSTGWAAISR